MNFNRLTPGSSETLPALSSAGRGLDVTMRGQAGGEFEQRATSIGAILLRYLGLASKYRYLIASFVSIALVIGFVATFMMPRIYSAATSVKIDRAAPKVLNNQSALMEGGNDPQFYQTQYELIRSRSLAERVAVSLNLAQSNFIPQPRQGLLSRALGEDPEMDAATIRSRQEQAIEEVMQGLSVRPVPMSSIVRISYSHTSPSWAQRISIAAAEQYERSTLDRRFTASGHARRFLDERLQQLKVKLQDSEKELVEYAQKHGIVNVDEKRPESLANLQAVQAALAESITQRLKREQLWQQAQENNGVFLPQVMNDSVIQAARLRLATLQATYQEKLQTLKPAFPEMVALRTQIIESERQIRAQIDGIRTAIRLEFEAAKAQEAALEAKLQEVKAEVLDIRGRSIEYTILMREVDTARSLYEGILQQFRELAVAGDVDTNNVSIVDRAQLPTTPDSPSLRNNLLLAFILGLMGAAGVIVVRESLDDTFKSPEDIEETLNLAVLGIAPLYVPEEEDRTAFDEVQTSPTSAMAEAYRSLRTALQFTTEAGAPKSLLVTSSRPGEGKSTTSASIALNFAQLGCKVLLIDGDLRNPSQHKVFRIENSAGLSNYLAGSDEASDLVKTTGVGGVSLMTTGPLPPNPAELLGGPRFATLLANAMEVYDVVIVDGPPVMGLADSPIIASIAHGTLLVIEAGKTRRGVVRDAVKRLEFARARIVGTLLNKFDPRRTGYTYGYGYSYGYGYGYGYGRDAMEYYGYGGAAKGNAPRITENRGGDKPRA